MAIQGVGRNFSPEKVGKILGSVKAYHLRHKEEQEVILGILPSIVGKIIKLKKFLGTDVTGTVINALGAFVAGGMIAANPISKTDPDTLFYTGIRYPISGVLSITTQAGIAIPFGILGANLANRGMMSINFDKSAMQDEKFLMRELKKANPNATEKELKTLLKSKEMNQLLAATRSMIENGTIMVERDGKMVATISPEEFRNVLKTAVDDEIKIMYDTNKRYGREKIPRQIARGKYLRSNYKDVEALIFGLKNTLSLSGDDSKAVVLWLEDRIKNLPKDVNPEMRQILVDLRDRRSIKGIEQKLHELEARLKLFSNRDENGTIIKNVHKVVDIVKNEIRQDIKNNNERLSALSKLKAQIKKVGFTMEQFIDVASQLKDGNLYYDVIQRYKNVMDGRIKLRSNSVEIAFAVSMAYITCHLLNILHPWTVKTLFPDKVVKKVKAPAGYVSSTQYRALPPMQGGGK